jgi:hypothetical protein
VSCMLGGLHPCPVRGRVELPLKRKVDIAFLMYQEPHSLSNWATKESAFRGVRQATRLLPAS